MTRGHRGSLLLRCRAFPSPPSCPLPLKSAEVHFNPARWWCVPLKLARVEEPSDASCDFGPARPTAGEDSLTQIRIGCSQTCLARRIHPCQTNISAQVSALSSGNLRRQRTLHAGLSRRFPPQHRHRRTRRPRSSALRHRCRRTRLDTKTATSRTRECAWARTKSLRFWKVHRRICHPAADGPTVEEPAPSAPSVGHQLRTTTRRTGGETNG